nr:uncharacterized protein LOC118877956 [Drosophila suzukii]
MACAIPLLAVARTWYLARKLGGSSDSCPRMWRSLAVEKCFGQCQAKKVCGTLERKTQGGMTKTMEISSHDSTTVRGLLEGEPLFRQPTVFSPWKAVYLRYLCAPESRNCFEIESNGVRGVPRRPIRTIREKE